MIELEKDEKIIFEIRKHWFQITLESIIFLMAALLPIPLIYLAGATYPWPWSESLSVLIVFFYSSWLLVVWIAFFVAWTDYYLDLWIITNKRVLDIEQKGLFRRDIASLPLENIQDIHVETTGIFETLLKLGEVEIQSSGAGKEFRIPYARHPDEAKRKISEILHSVKSAPTLVKIDPDLK